MNKRIGLVLLILISLLAVIAGVWLFLIKSPGIIKSIIPQQYLRQIGKLTSPNKMISVTNSAEDYEIIVNEEEFKNLLANNNISILNGDNFESTDGAIKNIEIVISDTLNVGEGSIITNTPAGSKTLVEYGSLVTGETLYIQIRPFEALKNDADLGRYFKTPQETRNSIATKVIMNALFMRSREYSAVEPRTKAKLLSDMFTQLTQGSQPGEWPIQLKIIK